MPKRIAVTVVKIKNLSTGICEICAQRLTTSAVEQPIINKPPIISPQRMLLSSMKALSTSEKDLRGGRGGAVGGGSTRGGASVPVMMEPVLIKTCSLLATETTETTAGVVGTGVGAAGGAGAVLGVGLTSRARSARIRLITCS